MESKGRRDGRHVAVQSACKAVNREALQPVGLQPHGALPQTLGRPLSEQHTELTARTNPNRL